MGCLKEPARTWGAIRNVGGYGQGEMLAGARTVAHPSRVGACLAAGSANRAAEQESMNRAAGRNLRYGHSL